MHSIRWGDDRQATTGTVSPVVSKRLEGSPPGAATGPSYQTVAIPQ